MVRGALQAYNTGACPDMQGWEHPAHLDVYVLNSEGQVQGGLLGLVRWRWLDVHMLALAPELRGQGLGSRVLRLAEAEARRRGCTRSMLDTASFQARPFYEKRGYRLVGEFPNLLPGVGSHWLAKDLAAEQEEPPGAASAGYELVVCDTADEARQKRVDEILMAFNVAACEVVRQAQESGYSGEPLEVYLLDAQGRVQGGFLANTCWQTLFLGELWIAAGLRGRGWGRRMVEIAEEEARKRNCTQVDAHIHGFQAPGFWRALGYDNIGEIPDFPPGHARIWLRKQL